MTAAQKTMFGIGLAVSAFTITFIEPRSAFAHMDCHARYDDVKSKINSKSLSADHREAAFRIAQHAYDMCTIGDEETADVFFEN